VCFERGVVGALTAAASSHWTKICSSFSSVTVGFAQDAASLFSGDLGNPTASERIIGTELFRIAH
jgi:hypothetical protein